MKSKFTKEEYESCIRGEDGKINIETSHFLLYGAVTEVAETIMSLKEELISTNRAQDLQLKEEITELKAYVDETCLKKTTLTKLYWSFGILFGLIAGAGLLPFNVKLTLKAIAQWIF